jgi:CDK inhibitor PHO81
LLAIEGHLDAIKLCFTHKANLMSDYYGRSPLHYAALNGHTDVCVYLISIGAEIDLVDQDGNTPLINAIVSGHVDTVNSLLEMGASFEPLPSSQIPVTMACQYGQLTILQNLLSKGVKLVANMDGLYPLHLACREGKTDITKCLIAHGADVEIQDSFKGWTSLFFASSEGHLDCVKVLLDAGCKVDIVDDSGWLAFTYSLYRGHLKVAEFLEPKVLPSRTIMEPISPPMIANQASAFAIDFEQDTSNSGGISKVGELDIDDIPSLSLPPPIIPLRI